MPRGDILTARSHREFLGRVRSYAERSGKTLTQIAKESRVAPSTLTRPLEEGDDGTSTLHANTIAKIVAQTGVHPPTEPELHSLSGRRGAIPGEDAAPFRAEPDDPILAAVQALAPSLANPAGALWTIRTRAVELAGFAPGDVAILEADRRPVPGDIVSAWAVAWPHNRGETLVRVYERAPPIELLVPRSLDPSLQQPIVIDGERVVVKGVFLPHRLRPREPAT